MRAVGFFVYRMPLRRNAGPAEVGATTGAGCAGVSATGTASAGVAGEIGAVSAAAGGAISTTGGFGDSKGADVDAIFVSAGAGFAGSVIAATDAVVATIFD